MSPLLMLCSVLVFPAEPSQNQEILGDPAKRLAIMKDSHGPF